MLATILEKLDLLKEKLGTTAETFQAYDVLLAVSF
jgi:hypothetical protein